MATLIAILVASLFGSLHCAGMCGPLVAFAVGGADIRSNSVRVLLHAMYHGGRLVSYASIGGVCGLLGAALDLGGAMAGLHRVASLLAGGMMIAVGIIAVLYYKGIRLPSLSAPFLQRLVVVGQRAAFGLRPMPRALSIGLLTAFLPCGWLYAFAIVATGTGSVIWGAAVMIAFWLGTVPVLASLGIGVQTLAGTVGRRIPLATAVAFVLLGLFTIGNRLAIPVEAFAATAAPVSGPDAAEQIKVIQQTKPPCCQHHGD